MSQLLVRVPNDLVLDQFNLLVCLYSLFQGNVLLLSEQSIKHVVAVCITGTMEVSGLFLLYFSQLIIFILLSRNDLLLLFMLIILLLPLIKSISLSSFSSLVFLDLLKSPLIVLLLTNLFQLHVSDNFLSIKFLLHFIYLLLIFLLLLVRNLLQLLHILQLLLLLLFLYLSRSLHLPLQVLLHSRLVVSNLLLCLFLLSVKLIYIVQYDLVPVVILINTLVHYLTASILDD